MSPLDQKLIDRIESAKRELRIASGVPLTETELEQEQRRKAVAALDQESLSISMGSGLNLYARAVWENGPAIMVHPFSGDPAKPIFYLRPAGNDFHFFQKMPDGIEVLLTTIPRKDAQLANKVLVSLGDALIKPE